MMVDIKPYVASASLTYTPEGYIEYCEENDKFPTQEGFLEFIQEWIDDDFGNHIVDVKVLDK